MYILYNSLYGFNGKEILSILVDGIGTENLLNLYIC